MNFEQLQAEAYATAYEKGWHDRPLAVAGRPDHDRVLRAHALIHSELTEAVECWLASDVAVRVDANGKPEGFLTELADVVIRIADTTQALASAFVVDEIEVCTRPLALPDTDVRLQLCTVRSLLDRATECVRLDDWRVYALLCASIVQHVISIAHALNPAEPQALDQAIEAKMRYNKTRPHRHGGKQA